MSYDIGTTSHQFLLISFGQLAHDTRKIYTFVLLGFSYAENFDLIFICFQHLKCQTRYAFGKTLING